MVILGVIATDRISRGLRGTNFTGGENNEEPQSDSSSLDYLMAAAAAAAGAWAARVRQLAARPAFTSVRIRIGMFLSPDQLEEWDIHPLVVGSRSLTSVLDSVKRCW